MRIPFKSGALLAILNLEVQALGSPLEPAGSAQRTSYFLHSSARCLRLIPAA